MSIDTRLPDDLLAQWYARTERQDAFDRLVEHTRKKAQLRPGEDLSFTAIRPWCVFDDTVELFGSYFCGGKLLGRHSQTIKVEPSTRDNPQLYDRILATLSYLTVCVRPDPGPKERIQRWHGKMRP